MTAAIGTCLLILLLACWAAWYAHGAWANACDLNRLTNERAAKFDEDRAEWEREIRGTSFTITAPEVTIGTGAQHAAVAEDVDAALRAFVNYHHGDEQ